MRKVPNVNIHIFKQPDIPWGIFNPSNLASDARTLLSWWDARTGITEETGVSNMADQGSGGWDFVQATGSDQPTFSGSNETALITYDGVSEFLEQPVTASNFQDLTRFEWWGVIHPITDKTIRSFTFNDAGDSNVNLVASTVVTGGMFGVVTRDNSGSGDNITADTLLNDNDFNIVGCVFTGSEYKIYINGVLSELTVNTGGNNGKFIGDIAAKATIDTFYISRFNGLSSVFAENKEKFQLCFGGTTDAALSTAAERTNIFNYINQAFNLGL